MILERVKSEGLAHNSYFLASGGDAVVIDPRRDCQIYLDLARRQGASIRLIFETHCNEDYLSGSRELSHFTGATIYHGPGLDWKFGHTLSDGQVFQTGRLEIRAVHTPGHTDESTCYVVNDLDTGQGPVVAFTGDTLFVGDAGRTDLYGPEEAPRLASAQHDSLFRKLLPLGDGVMVCPGHGSGSVCGARIADRDMSSIGIERRQNPVLQVATRDEFVRLKSSWYLEIPHYFSRMGQQNRLGPPVMERLPMPASLTPREFRSRIEQGFTVLDTREPPGFGGSHIKGAYSIWLHGVALFPGWVLDYEHPMLLVLESDSDLDMVVRYLVRIGFDRIAGHLRGGMPAWYDSGLPVERLPLLSVHELHDMMDRHERFTLLDVRSDDEWSRGKLPGARHIYVGYLQDRIQELPRDAPVVVYCSVGHRAGIAASILLRAGFVKVYNVLGSYTAWVKAGFPVVRDESHPVKEGITR